VYCRICKTALRHRVREGCLEQICPNRQCKLHGDVQAKEILPVSKEAVEIAEVEDGDSFSTAESSSTQRKNPRKGETYERRDFGRECAERGRGG